VNAEPLTVLFSTPFQWPSQYTLESQNRSIALETHFPPGHNESTSQESLEDPSILLSTACPRPIEPPQPLKHFYTEPEAPRRAASPITNTRQTGSSFPIIRSPLVSRDLDDAADGDTTKPNSYERASTIAKDLDFCIDQVKSLMSLIEAAPKELRDDASDAAVSMAEMGLQSGYLDFRENLDCVLMKGLNLTGIERNLVEELQKKEELERHQSSQDISFDNAAMPRYKIPNVLSDVTTTTDQSMDKPW
jgi:hypothetical protein